MNSSLRNLAGVTAEPRYVGDDSSGQIQGNIRLYELDELSWVPQLLDQYLADKEAGEETPNIGLSAVIWHFVEKIDGKRVTTKIRAAESVDLVFSPGAGGAVLAALQAARHTTSHSQKGGTIMPPENQDESGPQTPQTSTQSASAAAPPATAQPPQTPPPVATPPVAAPPLAPPTAFGGMPAQQGFTSLQGWTPEQQAMLMRANQESHNLLVGQCQSFLEAQLMVVSNLLPPASIQYIRSQFQGRTFAPQELEAAITAQRNIAAELTQHRVIRGVGAGDMQDSMDQITSAYEQLMGLPVDEPVHRLMGIKELYVRLTGDRNMTGMFNPDEAMLTATPTSMAVITANVMNKVLVTKWEALAAIGYDWYEKVAQVEEFTSLHNPKWIRVDGFADLPSVSPGEPYLELPWDDDGEDSTWDKKGGYLGLAIETIDKDDTQAWRQVPIGLAIAGIRTLSAKCSALFTSNDGVGPTLNDGYSFFDAVNRGNCITEALDADTWDLASQTMFKLTEAGSGKRQGIRPWMLMVPIELEKEGLKIFTSEVEPKEGVFYSNVRRMSPDNVLTRPEWTDPYSWCAVAHPAIRPAIGIGFRWGRKPELTVVMDPNSGLMFTHDTLPIRVRFMVTVCAINPLGAVKSNVP
jgi:hypothetical protein